MYGGTVTSNVGLVDLTAEQGFSITGTLAYGSSTLGHSVAGAGDFNNDGYADLIVGAPGAYSSTGFAYIIYGGNNLVDFNITDLTSDQGFSIAGITPGDACGWAVAGLGDIYICKYCNQLCDLWWCW